MVVENHCMLCNSLVLASFATNYIVLHKSLSHFLFFLLQKQEIGAGIYETRANIYVHGICKPKTVSGQFSKA